MSEKIKNEVVEKQYEDLKNGIKFRIENNITDDWEQHYHCIDVLCEEHKARIRDIENSICKIQDLEAKLAQSKMNESFEKEKKDNAFKLIDQLRQQLQEEKNRSKKLNHEAQKYYEDAYCNGSQNEKAIAELEKVKADAEKLFNLDECNLALASVLSKIDQQIAELKGEK